MSCTKAAFASNDAGRDQTCHHRPRIAWPCQARVFASGKALFSPLAVRISHALRLRGLSATAQLSAGRARASKGGGTMIRRLRALGGVLELAPCDPATASCGGSLDHKPCRIGFASIVQISQSLRGTGGTLVAFSQISSNSMRSLTIIE